MRVHPCHGARSARGQPDALRVRRGGRARDVRHAADGLRHRPPTGHDHGGHLDAGTNPQRRRAGGRSVLTTVPGLGKKTAQRIILDLRDRLGGPTAETVALPGSQAGWRAQVIEALTGLGGPRRRHRRRPVRSRGGRTALTSTSLRRFGRP